MANFFKPSVTHNMVGIITAVAFTTAIIAPPPAYAAGANMNINDLPICISSSILTQK